MVAKFLHIVVAILLSTPLFAQSILDRATAVYRDSDFCEVSLIVSVSNIDNQTEPQKATLQLSGNKYILEFSDQRIFSDGESTYTFSKSANELIIENIDSQSPLQSPRSLLAINSKLFDVTNTVEKNGETILTLKSNEDIAGVNRIVVTIQNNKLLKVKVIDNGDNVINIDILSTDFNKIIDEDEFEYDKKNYKGVEIIDFR